MNTPPDACLAYYRQQHISPQWQAVLTALSQELGQQFDPEGLRTLWAQVGERLASEGQDRWANAQTLQDLQEALNAFWAEKQWGLVQLSEGDGQVLIDHWAAPLADAFGADALDWSVGLLEGFYQAVFSQMGAGQDMRVRAQPDAGDTPHIQLALSADPA